MYVRRISVFLINSIIGIARAKARGSFLYKMNSSCVLMIFLVLVVGAQALGSDNGDRNIIYVYPGGTMVGQFEEDDQALCVRVLALTDEMIAAGEADLAHCGMIYMPGVRFLDDKESFCSFFTSAREQHPELKIVTSTRGFMSIERAVPELAGRDIFEKDEQVEKYTNFNNISQENMRRLLVYLAVTYMDSPGNVEPPEIREKHLLHHPDREEPFGSVEEFFAWSRERGMDTNGPRALVETHFGQLMINQPGIDALVREFEKQGVLAAAMNTIDDTYEEAMKEFDPDVLMIWTGKSGRLEFYLSLGAPRLQPIFLMGETINQWKNPDLENSTKDPTTGRMRGMLVMRESQGVIEPHVAAGPVEEGGGFTVPRIPIPERVTRFVARAAAWAHLARKQNPEKKIAIQYLGPAGKHEVLLGTPDCLMAESIIRLLGRMKDEGYGIDHVPSDQDELIDLILDHGRQILSSNPSELDRVARSGLAALVPVETYRAWFESKVPPEQQSQVIHDWGAVPGKFMVWQNDSGEKFIVIPKIDLGNVLLVPKQFPELEDALSQENRETLLKKLKEDPYSIVPSHNELATNFWIEETLEADALIVWEFLIMDYILPRKTVALRDSDWPDILMGTLPNIRPWPICELHWSLPAKRRTYAVLADHLTSPEATAGLSDEMLNLSNDILKWINMPEGSLEERFRRSIAQQVRDTHLDLDLHLDLSDDRPLTPEEVHKLAAYLNELQQERIKTNFHVLGQVPSEDSLMPWIATCLRSRFRDSLEEIIPVPEENDRLPGERKIYMKQKAEDVLRSFLIRNMSPAEAVVASGGQVDDTSLPETLEESFAAARKLYDGFLKTHLELDNMLLALNGQFMPPGPGNLPERNPAVIPTGNNMNILNPEEVPSKPSWELGKQLVDQLLERKLEEEGRYPHKIALSLNFRSTLMDYGVLESQILYLIGVRPVWDASNQVLDVELIPASELGRPRIDVFIETYDYYPDYLESRLRLWDKAIRLVSSLDEPDNYVYQNRVKSRQLLEADGISPERAKILSSARIFALAPESMSMTHFLLLEETGEWDSRRELVDVYLAERDYVYTEGAWGEKSPTAYRRHIEGTEMVLRNITRGGPLGGGWYNGGNLSLVIEELTGQTPEYFLSDLRTPGEEFVIRAEDALRKDLRAGALQSPLD